MGGCVCSFVLSEVPEYMVDTRRLGLKCQHQSHGSKFPTKEKFSEKKKTQG